MHFKVSTSAPLRACYVFKVGFMSVLDQNRAQKDLRSLRVSLFKVLV